MVLLPSSAVRAQAEGQSDQTVPDLQDDRVRDLFGDKTLLMLTLAHLEPAQNYSLIINSAPTRYIMQPVEGAKTPTRGAANERH